MSTFLFIEACVRVLICCECMCCVRFILFILMSKLLLYSAGSGVNRVLVDFSGFNVKLVCFVQT